MVLIKIILGIFLANLPCLFAIMMLAIVDHIARNRHEQKNGRRRDAEEYVSKRKTFSQRIATGMHDPRLVSKKLEKTDKWGLSIDPGPMALTWSRLQLILLLASAIMCIIGIIMPTIPLVAAGMIVSSVAFGLMNRNGKAKIESEKTVYDKIIGVLNGHMNLDTKEDPKKIIEIDDWTSGDQPQVIADATIKAREDGEYEELKNDLPKPDKKGRMQYPKISTFRDIPLNMVVNFPVSFRESYTDDTLSHLNEAFGHKTEWIAERDVKNKKTGKTETESGWSFDEGKAYLKTVPPLPTMASLPENFNEGVFNKIKLGATVSGECTWDINQAPMSLICGLTGSGKSVLQRNIIFGCIAHTDDIKFLGIDLKQVELSQYAEFSDAVLGVATTLEDAVILLRYANKTMHSRFTAMKKMGYNDIANVPNHGPAIMVMVDEAGQLLDMSGPKGDETELKTEAQNIIGQIARLGRAAGVHLCIATQRPNATMIPGELKENLGFRVGCGHLTSIASSMAFDSGEGMKTPAKPKGRAAAMVVGQKAEPMQVYFTRDYRWMVEWMKRRGKNPDNTPISTGPSVETTSGIDKLKDADTIDASLGIDNDAQVEEEFHRRQLAAKAHEDAVRKLKEQQGGNAADAQDTSEETQESENDDTAANNDDNADGVFTMARPQLKGDDEEEKHDPDEDWDSEMDDIIGE